MTNPAPRIHFVDEELITEKRILVRVDFNVSLTEAFTIADDARIQQSLPTIRTLLQSQNRLILISHLGRPKGRDLTYSLRNVERDLKQYLPEYEIILIDDFVTADKSVFEAQKPNQVFILENIRFYPQEKENNEEFAKKLASLADLFVNDAFGVCHRNDASVVGIPKFIPSYGGLLLKKEVQMISKIVQNPKKPFVAILGGVKISTKIQFIDKLMELADHLLLGGGIASTLLAAQGHNVGTSFLEDGITDAARKILEKAAEKNTTIILPKDVVVAPSKDSQTGDEVYKIDNIPPDQMILDIGPETQAEFASIIAKANTIVWNGPVGYMENPQFKRGTDFIYYSIADNDRATSIVGGGDTLAAVSKKEHLEKISHVSTGGGAMLEFIEKGTLPGIDVLKR